MINDSIDTNIDNGVIDYCHEKFQLTKNDENIIFNPNEWLNDQNLAITMQISYFFKLQLFGYQQHTYINII
jgi:hypothetical protein